MLLKVYSGAVSGWIPIGATGFSGASGYSGLSGYSGDNQGSSGYSGKSGYSGWSGYSGYSSFSGYSGWSGYSGSPTNLSGYVPYSGASGTVDLNTRLIKAGSAQIGGVSDYSIFEADGTLRFVGAATVWKKQVCQGYAWKDDAVNPPTWNNSGFAGTAIGYTTFNFHDENYIHFVLDMPTDYKQMSDIFWFVNFTNDVAFASSMPTDVFWDLDWSWANQDFNFDYRDCFGTIELTLRESEMRNKTAWTDQVTRVGRQTPLEEIQGQINSKIACRLTRPASKDRNEVNLVLLEVGFWYEIDTIGARSMGTK